MSFSDDEPVNVATADVSGGRPSAAFNNREGRIKVEIINKSEAPLKEGELKVLVELTGTADGKEASGLDLVMVLDLSGSLGQKEEGKKGGKLAKMKQAVQFVIKKLRPIDRLSVVTCFEEPRRLCPLRQITEDSQSEIANQVNALAVDRAWFANKSPTVPALASLQMGVQVLKDRKLTSERAAGIMLLSDGVQTTRRSIFALLGAQSLVAANATVDADVPVSDVPVYTFGFGTGQDPWLLNDIAQKSRGGTFLDVRNTDDLSIAFSQCLAGLLTMAVEGLELTVKPEDLTINIKNVSAGNYPQTPDINKDGSVKISFGDLFNREIRRVMVDLLLPIAPSPKAAVNVLQVDYTYKCTGGKVVYGSPLYATISRTETTVELQEREEVVAEANRIRTAEMIKEARVIADDKKLDDAVDKLIEAENLLEDELVDKSNTSIEMLKFELQQLLWLMPSQEIYEKQGRPFALSSGTSHDRQRFAARGDMEKLRLFATPRMDAYLEQAKSHDQDPSKPLPTPDEDLKKDVDVVNVPSSQPLVHTENTVPTVVSDPLVPVAGALNDCIRMAIKSIRDMDESLKGTNKALDAIRT